jgi:hypothetical protein
MKKIFYLMMFLLSLQILSQTKNTLSSLEGKELNNKIILNKISSSAVEI